MLPTEVASPRIKQSIEDGGKQVIKVVEMLECLLNYIDDTKEYYCNGVDEELKDMIGSIIKMIENKGE